MKIYFDTNIIIDVLKRREPFYENSNKIFMLAVDGKIIAAIAMREKADYIITRNTKDFSKSSIQAITPDVFLANVKQ